MDDRNKDATLPRYKKVRRSSRSARPLKISIGLSAATLSLLLGLVTLAWNQGLVSDPAVLTALNIASVFSASFLFSVLKNDEHQHSAPGLSLMPLHEAFAAASEGDPDSCGLVAMYYLRLLDEDKGSLAIKALGMSREDIAERAISHMESAARAGSDIAQFNLGMMYELGNLFEEDARSARYWYAQATRRGYPKAQHKFAVMCLDGVGGNQSDRLAFYALKLSSSQGLAVSCFCLSEMLGDRRKPQFYNRSAADELLHVAAKQGSSDAINKIAERGCNRSERNIIPLRSAILFTLAVRMGNDVAMENFIAVRSHAATWKWYVGYAFSRWWRVGYPLPLSTT